MIWRYAFGWCKPPWRNTFGDCGKFPWLFLLIWPSTRYFLDLARRHDRWLLNLSALGLAGCCARFWVGAEGPGAETRAFWTFLHSVRTTPFFLQTSSVWPSIAQCVHLACSHSYITCCLRSISSSLKNSIYSGKGPSIGVLTNGQA